MGSIYIITKIHYAPMISDVTDMNCICRQHHVTHVLRVYIDCFRTIYSLFLGELRAVADENKIETFIEYFIYITSLYTNRCYVFLYCLMERNNIPFDILHIIDFDILET